MTGKRQNSAGFWVLSLLLMLPVLGGSSQTWADDDTPPPTEAEVAAEKKRSFTTGTAFFDDARLSGGLYYFQRHRTRYNPDGGGYEKNLNHGSGQANVEFQSGFAGGVVGIDFGVFGSLDMHNSGAVDHEMNFVPWRNPWHAKWNNTQTQDGASIYKAHLKLKAGPFWGKAGYFQPSGPGVLGVNWSIMPGTYQGAEAGFDAGGLTVAGAWVNEYKAPWYRETYAFERQDGTTVDALWTLGARYTFENKLSIELAYGEAEQFTQNAHMKLSYPLVLEGGTLTLGYHLYAMNDKDDDAGSPNNLYDAPAFQHYAFTRYETELWTFALEGTYTRAPQDAETQRGYFAYRLTVPSGSSKGAYGAWWDARSDWNHDGEKAVFGRISRKLDDVLPVKGISVGIGGAFGWDGRAYGVAEHLREWAVTGDVGYTRQEGPLKGSSLSVHYTEYRNGTDRPSWDGFHNAFQDERDIKILAVFPFTL